MNPKLRENIKKFGPLVNLLVILTLLGFIWIKVHWSVAVMLAWMAYSISVFADGMNLFRAEMTDKLKAVKEYAEKNNGNFTQFINTVNRQAEEFRNRGIKPIFKVPPDVLEKDDRPSCRECLKAGYPELYKQNNCPIHN